MCHIRKDTFQYQQRWYRQKCPEVSSELKAVEKCLFKFFPLSVCAFYEAAFSCLVGIPYPFLKHRRAQQQHGHEIFQSFFMLWCTQWFPQAVAGHENALHVLFCSSHSVLNLVFHSMFQGSGKTFPCHGRGLARPMWGSRGNTCALKVWLLVIYSCLCQYFDLAA